VRSEPALACQGRGTFAGQTAEVYMLFWQDSVDDLMAVIYVAKAGMDEKLPDMKTTIAGIEVH
jgi:hypothetical protein